MIEEEVKASIQSGIIEFNKLYGELNQRLGGVSYLIAKNAEHSDNLEE